MTPRTGSASIWKVRSVWRIQYSGCLYDSRYLGCSVFLAVALVGAGVAGAVAVLEAEAAADRHVGEAEDVEKGAGQKPAPTALAAPVAGMLLLLPVLLVVVAQPPRGAASMVTAERKPREDGRRRAWAAAEAASVLLLLLLLLLLVLLLVLLGRNQALPAVEAKAALWPWRRGAYMAEAERTAVAPRATTTTTKRRR